MNSKHMKEETFDRGKALKIILILFLIIGVVVASGVVLYMQIGQPQNEEVQTEVSQEPDEVIQEVKEENVLSTLQIVEVDMPEKLGKYNILGEIEIPKINVKKYILDVTTDESLNLSLTRFWGEGIHKPSNFSIIGHNYKGLFKDLKKMELGDTFTITDKEGKICTYVIYEIFIVEPDDVSCIDDTLDGQREVTLITCTTGGAKRLILKAKEQK